MSNYTGLLKPIWPVGPGLVQNTTKRVIGPFGLKNRNAKGRKMLGVFNACNLRVVNSVFQKPSFTTLRSFGNYCSPHMLDVMTTSRAFFKHTRDCETSPLGMMSDHLAVRLKFQNRSIKFRNTHDKKTVIDWKKIQTDLEVNFNFNFSLQAKLGEAPHN